MGVLTPLMVEARDAPIPVGSYLNGVFPEGIPGAAGEWLTIPTFPNLTFTDPMWVTPWPGSDHMLMVERVGKLKRFPNRQDAQMDEVETLLDWTSVTQTSYDEQGFYSAVFHPKFADTTDPKRFVYICYTHQLVEGVDTSGEFADSYWRLTRIEFNADGEFIPGSETILISLYDPQQWHNGGAMFFGEDGLLYVSNGDGGERRFLRNLPANRP
jgi:glucose/arabinose dehydrogenase